MESGISMHRVIGELARGRITRREAVKLLLASGAAATLFPALASADDGTVAGIPLARPDKPVTLPTFRKPIESGMKPESGGSFYIFNYDEYVDPKLMEAFGKKYGVKVVLNAFGDIDEAITKLAAGTVQAESATPMVRSESAARCVTAVTPARSSPASAAAPAILNANTMPATPRRLSRSANEALATSSRSSTVVVSMSSNDTRSPAMSKFMTSPP